MVCYMHHVSHVLRASLLAWSGLVWSAQVPSDGPPPPGGDVEATEAMELTEDDIIAAFFEGVNEEVRVEQR